MRHHRKPVNRRCDFPLSSLLRVEVFRRKAVQKYRISLQSSREFFANIFIELFFLGKPMIFSVSTAELITEAKITC